MRTSLFAIAAVSMLGLSACNPSDQAAVAGGLAGATGGFVLAELFDFNNTGRLLAVAAGATAGSVIARNESNRDQCAYADGRGGYYVADCP